MVRSQSLLGNPQRAVEQGLGIGIAAKGYVKHCEVVEVSGEGGTIGPEFLLAEPNGLSMERQRLFILALVVKCLTSTDRVS